MKLRVSTVLNNTRSRIFEELKLTNSLREVSRPLLFFESADGSPIPLKWQIGENYRLKLKLFGLIPIGRHSICIKKFDTEEYVVERTMPLLLYFKAR